MSAPEFPPEVVEAVARAISCPYDKCPHGAECPQECGADLYTHDVICMLRALPALGYQRVPNGYAVVPMEPTQEQLTAAFERDMAPGEDLYRSIYHAMVAALLARAVEMEGTA
jgi:hypothetical protein